MTDDELLLKTAEAHRRARDASPASIGERHTGERHILHHTDGYARFGAEWCQLADEVDRRGLKQPMIDEAITSSDPAKP